MRPGQVAVVTGAASGLGLAMARGFAAAGLKVVLADVEEQPLTEAAGVLRAKGHDVLACRTDVSSPGDVEALADLAYERFGAVHVLCNNAGVVKRGRSWELTLDDWRWVLDVDLMGVVHGLQSFVPRMVEDGQWGHVVNTGSMTGLLPTINLAAYSTAKAAVTALSEVLALDLAAEGSDIGVSVLCPGFVATGITSSERNRPAVLAAASSTTGPRTTAGVAATMTADEVAGHVLDAVRHRRFWVLTHQDYAPLLIERAQGIAHGAQPVSPPIW